MSSQECSDSSGIPGVRSHNDPTTGVFQLDIPHQSYASSSRVENGSRTSNLNFFDLNSHPEEEVSSPSPPCPDLLSNVPFVPHYPDIGQPLPDLTLNLSLLPLSLSETPTHLPSSNPLFPYPCPDTPNPPNLDPLPIIPGLTRQQCLAAIAPPPPDMTPLPTFPLMITTQPTISSTLLSPLPLPSCSLIQDSKPVTKELQITAKQEGQSTLHPKKKG